MFARRDVQYLIGALLESTAARDCAGKGRLGRRSPKDTPSGAASFPAVEEVVAQVDKEQPVVDDKPKMIHNENVGMGGEGGGPRAGRAGGLWVSATTCCALRHSGAPPPCRLAIPAS